MGKNTDIEDVRSRNFKLLLYPDNPKHLAVMDAIALHYPSYVGIEHIMFDDIGNKIVEGAGKLHFHYAIILKNPVFINSLCKKIGLVTDLGEADTQFCRPIVGRYSDFLLYMLHAKYDDKEHYELADMFGSPDLINETARALIRYQKTQFDMSDCVLAILDWIRQQGDNIISWSGFGWWVCHTPYFRASNNLIVRQAIEEHNHRIYRAENARAQEMIQQGYARSNEIGLYGRIDSLSQTQFFEQFGDGWSDSSL